MQSIFIQDQQVILAEIINHRFFCSVRLLPCVHDSLCQIFAVDVACILALVEQCSSCCAAEMSFSCTSRSHHHKVVFMAIDHVLGKGNNLIQCVLVSSVLNVVILKT